MKNLGLQVKLLDSVDDARVCAGMMADSEPWISLGRGFEDSLGIITDPSRDVYVAWIGDEIVGFVVVEMTGTFKGYIKSVYVLPEFRCRGIGSMLMKHVESKIFSATPNVFLLVSSFNTEARRLYEKLGYEQVGELKDFVVRSHSEILMRKTLCPLTEFKTG